jgi:hypothetical protein
MFVKILLMDYFIFLIIGLFIGTISSWIFYVKLFKKKIIKYKDAYHNSKNDYFSLSLRYREREKKLERYYNQFHDKYVDDGYEAY